MFWLKKWFGTLLLPLPFGLLLLLTGLALLWLRRRWSGRAAVTAGLLVLVLLASSPLPQRLLAELEWQQPPLLHTDVPLAYVAVLGNWHLDAAPLPPLQQLRPPALARLVEGARLLRAHPGSRLILSGCASEGKSSHALVLRDAALALGVPAEAILVVDGPRDTAEEVVQVGQLVGNAPFALVTSAAHMWRALALFRGQGLEPLPAPTDYLTPPPESNGQRSLRSLLPDAANLEQSERWLHETFGLWWARLRGQA